MKKLLFVLLGAFALSTATVYAQEPVIQDAKAAKLQEKEAKRKAKEEKKAKKAQEKADKKAEKAEKKDKKLAKLRAEYEEFIANYEPLNCNTGYPEVDAFMSNANTLFLTMVNVEQTIGYIEVVTEQVEDPMTGEMVTQATGIRNKKTGEPIKKSDALKNYGAASLKLTAAAAQGATLVSNGISAVTGAFSNPMSAIGIIAQAKKVFKSIKMTVNVIPLIQREIKENQDALKFYKDNLAGDEEAADSTETTTATPQE